MCRFFICSFALFFFNDPATTEIYTLSLHDALPIWNGAHASFILLYLRLALLASGSLVTSLLGCRTASRRDRKSTRLNSSHTVISYAVFCLKKKKKKNEKNKKKDDNK